jgi:hypothetical protein
MPFIVFGTDDNKIGYFKGRSERLIDINIPALTKTDLLTLAPLEYWSKHFAIKGRVQWEEATDFIIGISQAIHFDPDKIRGRGCWREPDGRICYHDGVNTIGDPSPDRWYLQKKQKNMKLDTPTLSKEEMNNFVSAALDLSFETVVDAMRLMSWSALSVFCGALEWRSGMLLTGETESGKSTILDYLINPLAKPVMGTGESTEAGVRQDVKNDATCIIIEEAEGDTKKKKNNREAIFSLMRQSTSENAPSVLKGTRGQKGISYKTRSQYGFIAIDAIVPHVADDNRLIKVNLKRPDKDFKPIFEAVKKHITPEACAAIRSATWKNLKQILEETNRWYHYVHSLSKWSLRNAKAQTQLMVHWLIVYKQVDKITESDLKHLTNISQASDDYDQSRDNADEMIQRIMDERLLIPPNKFLTVREMLIVVATGKIDEYSSEINEIDKLTYKEILARHGIISMRNERVGIAYNHHEIMKIINMKQGYHRMLRRHQNVTDERSVIKALGKSRNVVVFSGLLETKKSQVEMEV